MSSNVNKFILGQKVGMTQVFSAEGNVIPVTVIKAEGCQVVQKKTVETDEYNAVKIGYGAVESKRMNKPNKGQFEKSNLELNKHLREFRVENPDAFEIGQKIFAQDMFQSGDKVDVTGISKGKGFQGNIKRHGQSGGKETHGSMNHRRVGSMGACSDPGRVFKGKKLPGHMGADKVTVQNLEVVSVDQEKGLILIRGSVPGPKGALLSVKSSVKSV